MILQTIASKTPYLFPLTLLLLEGGASPNTAIRPSEGTNWTGTISYRRIRTNYHSAPYSEFVYHMWRHSYDQQMEAQISNGKGIAKSTVALLDTSYNLEKIGNRTVEQWQIDKGSARGSGKTEVSIYIDPRTRLYSIEVPIPETKGTTVRTSLCRGCDQAAPGPVTISMGEDETSIVVENEKSGANADVLANEKIERKKTDDGEGEEITITRWKFTKVKR